VLQRQLADVQGRIGSQAREIGALQARPSIAPEVVNEFTQVVTLYKLLDAQESKTEATLNTLSGTVRTLQSDIGAMRPTDTITRRLDAACSNITYLGSDLKDLYRKSGMSTPSNLYFLGC
jgi:hypothetical protein